eukprot:CAMPEP_0180418958 /NCGR_PEP_ID=MMETSP1036_2-20121128/1837_1 /TAXON_ID=632150 /ORGANISM="Azadinium spinosum, Strain 3D9" /LENGTH=170 /DNA_ID=CAMNT_0022424075 /DNA_START=395 /DNA_END=907 /DNA_ORIENTATION=+
MAILDSAHDREALSELEHVVPRQAAGNLEVHWQGLHALADFSQYPDTFEGLQLGVKGDHQTLHLLDDLVELIDFVVALLVLDGAALAWIVLHLPMTPRGPALAALSLVFASAFLRTLAVLRSELILCFGVAGPAVPADASVLVDGEDAQPVGVLQHRVVEDLKSLFSIKA